LDANVSAAWRTCGISIESSPSAVCTLRARKAVAQPALVAALLALGVQPPLVPRTTEPRVELVLNRALDDQAGSELRQLTQRLARVLTHPNRQHVLDPSLDLRRRRYGTSHGLR
jgi:hypothetical protein